MYFLDHKRLQIIRSMSINKKKKQFNFNHLNFNNKAGWNLNSNMTKDIKLLLKCF